MTQATMKKMAERPGSAGLPPSRPPRRRSRYSRSPRHAGRRLVFPARRRAAALPALPRGAHRLSRHHPARAVDGDRGGLPRAGDAAHGRLYRHLHRGGLQRCARQLPRRRRVALVGRPADCTGPLSDLTTGGSLLSQLQSVHVVQCDVAAWRFLGISLAGYNVLISLLLAAIAGSASSRANPPRSARSSL